MAARRGDAWPSIGFRRGEPVCDLLVFLIRPVVSMLGLYCAIPAAMATLVCRHRRKGEEWMTTLCFSLRFFRGASSPSSLLCSLLCLLAKSCDLTFLSCSGAAASCSRASSRVAMRTPSARHWVHPPYVKGGSYGVGVERCQDGSDASSRRPCL